MMQKRRMLTIGLCSLMAVGLCFFSANHAQAASGNGPYYAEPSWSQKLPAATRFVVLTDWNSEAVLDRETGLVWERMPAVTLHREFDAQRYCSNRTTSGRKGWRLPSVHEPGSLIDPSVLAPGPTLPPGHPFSNIKTGNMEAPALYWSATTSTEVPNSKWTVDFSIGEVNIAQSSEGFLAWCVRGSMNADAY